MRLQYECNPMAYIIEKAGGKAHSGVKAVLDIQPTGIHDRAPIFIGSTENVDDYLRIREKCQKKWSERTVIKNIVNMPSWIKKFESDCLVSCICYKEV